MMLHVPRRLRRDEVNALADASAVQEWIRNSKPAEAKVRVLHLPDKSIVNLPLMGLDQ